MKSLKIGTVLSVLYILFAWSQMVSLGSDVNSDAEAFGAGIAAMLILPHLVIGTIGMIFNLIGYKIKKRGFILTAAILYTIAIVLCIFWAFLLIPGMIFMWIGYAKMKNQTDVIEN